MKILSKNTAILTIFNSNYLVESLYLLERELTIHLKKIIISVGNYFRQFVIGIFFVTQYPEKQKESSFQLPQLEGSKEVLMAKSGKFPDCFVSLVMTKKTKK